MELVKTIMQETGYIRFKMDLKLPISWLHALFICFYSWMHVEPLSRLMRGRSRTRIIFYAP
jgi:hypothetical protein